MGKKIDGDLPLRSLEIKGKWLGLVEILRDLRSWERWKDGDCIEVYGNLTRRARREFLTKGIGIGHRGI